jgi:O-methyltransferase involved in polyketide biosynthesis
VTEREPVDAITANTPNVARMYDYYLGGKDNFANDRAAADEVLAIAPATRALARANRDFLGRAIRFLSAAGIRQFIDVGSGLPTRENAHEVAQRAAPDSRVVYVDNDPVVLAHSRALLAKDQRTVIVGADMREPGDILEHPGLRDALDLSRPVAVLFVSVLHCLTDEDGPAQIVARFRERMAPGSHLVISHITAMDQTDTAERGAEVYRKKNASTAMTLRDPQQIRALFDGFELLEPGLVPLPEWRPVVRSVTDGVPGGALPTWFLCGVGRRK